VTCVLASSLFSRRDFIGAGISFAAGVGVSLVTVSPVAQAEVLPLSSGCRPCMA
jgi:hypothetical protein